MFFSRLIWLGSVALILIGMAGLFLLLPRPVPLRPVQRARVPKFYFEAKSFRRISSESDDFELNAIRSPALIALPLNFSDFYTTENKVACVAPPSKSLYQKGLLREQKPLIPRDDTMEYMQTTPARYQPLVMPAVFAGPPPAGRPAVQVELSGGLKGKSLDSQGAFPSNVIPAGFKGKVTAFVQVDRHGRVAHVFLESPSEDATLNARLVRMLYLSRFGPATEAGYEGRVTFHAFGGTSADLKPAANHSE